MKKTLFTLSILLSMFLCFSCATTKKNSAEKNIEEDNAFPFVTKPCEDNEIIVAYRSGKILSKYDPVPSSFNDVIVFECESEYYMNKKTNTSVYELIYVGVAPLENLDKNIEQSTEIAKSTAPELKLVCRSKNLDEYLVSCSTTLPKKYNGYYYFLPGMLLNNTMKFLDFADIEEFQYEWLYHHTVDEDPDDPEWAPGTSFVSWNAYMNTPLPAYPELLEKPFYYSGIPMESYTKINYNGIDFELYFQPGFKTYLEEECKPGDPIYLYLYVEACNFFTKSYTAFVRDFSLKSPEEIIEERMQIIKEKLQ